MPPRGWAGRGTTLTTKVPHGRWKTTTFVAALRHDRIDASWLLDGPIDSETFRICVEKALIPTLKPGDIVIMDNLGSHRGKVARQLKGSMFLSPDASMSSRGAVPSWSLTRERKFTAGHCSSVTQYTPMSASNPNCRRNLSLRTRNDAGVSDGEAEVPRPSSVTSPSLTLMGSTKKQSPPPIEEGSDGRCRWWTFGGGAGNRVLAGLLELELGERVSPGNTFITFSNGAAASIVAIHKAIDLLAARSLTWEDASRLVDSNQRSRVSKFQPCLPTTIEHGLIAPETMNVDDANATGAQWKQGRKSQEGDA